MITVRRHTSRDYAALPDIDRSDVGALTDRDQRCLDDVGSYLVGTKAHGRFGIALLHSHFAVADDEMLVEMADGATRTLTLRALPPAQQAADYHALSFCFDPAGRAGQLDLVGLEYGRRSEYRDVKPLSGDDVGTLRGLRAILERHGEVGRFGVRLIHDPLRLTADEVLLESCDPATRTLECEVTVRDDPRFVTAVETFWCWEPAAGDVRSSVQSCRRNCLQGCISGAGPDGGHHKGPHDTIHDR